MILSPEKKEAFEFLSLPEMKDFWRDIDGLHIDPDEKFKSVESTILFNGRILFMFDRPWTYNGTTYSGMHFAADKNSRGAYAVESGLDAIEWYKKESGVDKIICSVFTDRPNHKRFCESLGMIEYSTCNSRTNFEVM